jgi:alpha-L-rhamnosidase
MQHQAPFVWIDRQGRGRNVHAYFRYDFRVSGTVARAVINLFADSRYHLKVNGEFVGYGPARYFQEHPEYDSYDISRFLKRGRNVIAVHALAHGMTTFQCPLSRGGFTAWGTVKLSTGRTLDLATPAGWKCRKATGYDQQAPKFSFTSSAIDLFDARKDVKDWDQPNCALKGWKAAVVVDDQDNWGRLTARSIPDLTQDTLVPKELLGAYPLLQNEDLYSFRVPGDDITWPGLNRAQRAFAYTYLFSPKRQRVEAGCLWGEWYLNGKELKRRRNEEIANRDEVLLPLKKGWNHLFLKFDLAQALWDFHLALPQAAGIIISATKKKRSKELFMVAGPFMDTQRAQVEKLALPFAEAPDLPVLPGAWRVAPRNGSAGNPAWEMAWNEFGAKKNWHPSQLADFSIDDAHGTALAFDMGHEVLGRIFVEFDAPKGTVIDLGFDEVYDQRRQRPHILHRYMIWAGERCIARGGRQRFETFKPRGFRYLQLNVTNSDAPVQVHTVGVMQQVYPYTKLGWFECSDPMLNSIWELGWRTLRMCSEDAYTDCPWRERGLYGGDMLAEFAVTMATTGDVRLGKRCVKLFAQSQNPQTGHLSGMVPRERPEEGGGFGDYPVLVLLNMVWIVEYSGDRAFAKRMYPVFRKMMESHLRQRSPDGLFHDTHVFIDWIAMVRDSTNCCMHALMAEGFAALGRLAGRLGETDDARKYAKLSKQIAALVRHVFWDEKTGAYRDGFTKDEKPIRQHLCASSGWPSLFGITTPAQEESIRAHYLKRLAELGDADAEMHKLETSPYGAFFLLGAMYRQGHADIAEWFIRLAWSRMILAGADTAWEHFTDESSLCHAWSAAPTYYLTSQALGVPLGFPEPLDPKELVIAPQSATLEWARGLVPHPVGPVYVEWRVEGARLMVTCDVPQGVRWSVRPRGRLAEKELWVNGKRGK